MNQPTATKPQATDPTVDTKLQTADSLQEIGYAVSVNDYLISISGLPNAEINEIITTEGDARALVVSLKENHLEAVMLDSQAVKPKQMFKRTKQSFSLEIGDFLLGRVINPLGIPIDGKGKFPPSKQQTPIAHKIPPIKQREFIKNQFLTGVTTVDMLVPLAQGQRELIIGDARSGKTSFLIDLIVNQNKSGVICIYAVIGKPVTEIRRLIDVLVVNKALGHSCIVAASSAEPASLIYLTPDIAISIAEYFQRQGKDVLLILDDLGAHAKFYREISLLGKKAPGRESYPGDIFFAHARILERAGHFNEKGGGGSITALPVIEIDTDDYTGYIPTNLMAMTDGHLMFNSSLYHLGVRPAVDESLSVSRVGRQTQGLVQKLLSDKIRSTLAEARRVETLSRFGSEVSAETQKTLKQKSLIEVILKQPPLISVPISTQMIILALIFTSFFDNKPTEFLTLNKGKLIKYLSEPQMIQNSTQALSSAKDEGGFIQIVTALIPTLEKVCQT